MRAQVLVREWTRSGLLNEAQESQLTTDLRVDLRRTNIFLRLLLFMFTGLIVGALVLLLLDFLQLRDAGGTAIVCAIAGVICFAAAELLVGKFRVYRFGVEEALAAAAVVLLIAAAVQMEWGDASASVIQVLALSIGALGGLLIYSRFGFVYAGIAAIVCVSAIPFFVFSALVAHLLASLVFFAIFVLVRRQQIRYGDEFPGDDYAAFQASAWAGLYLVLNLQLNRLSVDSVWFYWWTYGMTWVLPIIGLGLGLRNRDRLLMNVSGAMALLTLATNKPYLGLKQQTWDPILFGIFLMGAVIVLRRRLSTSEKNGERSGFTAERILATDSRFITMVSTAAGAFEPASPSGARAEDRPDPGGGRSGGAGASGSL